MQELNITDIHRQFEAGSLSVVALTRYYLEQIELHLDLGAVITVNPDAITRAEALDKAMSEDQPIGPLFGVPILLKDNIDTHDRMPNTAGSRLLKDNFPTRDADLVSKLRQAGAVILGKANLSEWANFRSNYSVSGWSAMGGQVRNPYDISRSPCGSSAGSAVAVAANLTTLAIGTETDGSVVCPAALTGIVGIKPTHGTISNEGIIPIAHSQDIAGPMARNVTDAVRLLEVMQIEPEKYSEHLRNDGLEGKTIGIVANQMGYHPNTDLVFHQAILDLAKSGAKITQCKLPHLREISKHEYQVVLYEFKTGITQYLKNSSLPYSTLSDLIAANQTHAADEFPYFGQDVFVEAESKGDLDDAVYKVALEASKRLSGPEGIDATLDACGADILIAPTMNPAWKIDTVMGDHATGGASMVPAVSGYPHITVPMGFVEGLPVGLSMFSRKNSESILIEAAFAFEQATLHRSPPKKRGPEGPQRHHTETV
jgi:amidase